LKLTLERSGIGLLKGLALTFMYLFRPRITTQYPEQRLTLSKRFRGYTLVWDKERCTGCATCAKSCPQGNIEIVTSKGTENDYVVDKFELDSGRCIFCGLCVESCPYNALFLGMEYERSTYRRGELVLPKDKLLFTPDKQRSAYARPELEAGLPRQTLLIEGDKGTKKR
jgi:NAD(P)H-quinone oxidoreductase subunit I